MSTDSNYGAAESLSRAKKSKDQAQRPTLETPGRLQQSLTNFLNRQPAQQGGRISKIFQILGASLAILTKAPKITILPD